MTKTATDVKTGTRTQAIFKTKVALATAFLGGAVLAASGVDIQMSKADLVIDRVAINEEVGAEVKGADRVTVYYSNQGNVTNKLPFSIGIKVKSSDGEDIKRIRHLVDYTQKKSGKFSSKLFLPKKHFSQMYLIPINAKYRSDQNIVEGLNEYHLEPESIGQVQFFIPRSSTITSDCEVK